MLNLLAFLGRGPIRIRIINVADVRANRLLEAGEVHGRLAKLARSLCERAMDRDDLGSGNTRLKI